MMSMKTAKFLKPSDTTSSYLDKNDDLAGIEFTHFVYNKYHSETLRVQRQRLPIFDYRNHILYLLEKYQTLVLVGETGSGKSTQIPQYLIEAKWPGQIGVCQPRRIAAISLANRVAEETGTLVQGETVGYTVRFDSCQNKPLIKYMTEGILLREMMSDPLLKNYSVVMLDEAHERSLYTDILMGLLKKILKKRNDLRLIVSSATLQAENLKEYFNDNDDNTNLNNKKEKAVILTIEGRQFPVEIYYVQDPVPCYVQSSIDLVLKLNSSKVSGDILVFLTGQEEVEKACKLLKQHADLIEQTGKKEKMLILSMYGHMPHYEQLKVFKNSPKDYRKVVVSTNVAETSVTIPGIVHVIDCGFAKMKWFNAETCIDHLLTMPISKSSADQRAGRAGRIKPGKVYRLYTKDFYEKLSQVTPPDIVRLNLTYAILQIKALGIKNLLRFDFPCPPVVENLKCALEILYALDAIDINGQLTRPLGFNMSEFALDPIYSKILLCSDEFGCTEQILTIISMLQVESVFAKPSTGNAIVKARIQKRLFEVAEGDLITYLNIYNAFMESDKQEQFCFKNFLNYKSLKRVTEIRQMLEKMLHNFGVPLTSYRGPSDVIRKCLVKGLFPNAVYLHHSGVYKTVRGDVELHIHPDSVLYTVQQPQWIIFCDLVHTTKQYMKNVTVINNEWLLELAPHFYYKTNT